jgi:hypothetical protein
MVRDKETRNTVRYTEQDNNKIGFLYIQKSLFDGNSYPREITVKIAFGEPG